MRPGNQEHQPRCELKPGTDRTPPWLPLATCVLVLVYCLSSWRSGLFGRPFVDLWGSLWSFDFAWRQLLQGRLPLVSADIFYPVGRNLYFDTGANYLDGILAVPLRALFGYPGFWNPWIAVVLVGNFVAGYQGGRILGLQPPACCGSGLLTALNPHTLFHLEAGRPTQAILWPYPLAMALLVRRGSGDALRAGLCTALAAWLYWFGGLFLAMGCLLMLLRRPRCLAAYMLGLLPVLPGVLPMVWKAAHGGVTGGDWNTSLPSYEALVAASDARSLVYTHQLGPLRFGVPVEAMEVADVPLHLVAAALVVVSLVEGASPLILPLLLGLVVVAGPSWRTAWGEVPLPYLALYRWLPFFSRLLFPDRALCLVAAAGALLAGLGIQRTVPTLGRAGGGGVVVLLVLLAMEALPGCLPLSTTTLQTSPYLGQVRAMPGAVIELPVRASSQAPALQPLHNRPTVFGMGIRAEFLWPPAYRGFVAGNPFLTELLALDAGRCDSLADATEARQALDRLGVHQVILYLQSPALAGGSVTNSRAVVMRTALERVLGPPVHSDEVLCAFPMVRISTDRAVSPCRRPEAGSGGAQSSPSPEGASR